MRKVTTTTSNDTKEIAYVVIGVVLLAITSFFVH